METCEIGATPKLPVERPIKFELIVNPKTDKAIGIQLPTSAPLGRTAAHAE
jgi:hypothetical protein